MIGKGLSFLQHSQPFTHFWNKDCRNAASAAEMNALDFAFMNALSAP